MGRILKAFWLCIAIAVALAGPAQAQTAEETVIRALLGDTPVRETLFTDEFLAAVPFAQIQPLLDQIRATIGPVESVVAKGPGNFLVETRTHELPVQISLDATGRIAGLLFQQALPKAGTAEDVLKTFAALAPQSAYLVTQHGKPLYSSNADRKLAVGSAFKLGVLAVLQADIVAGRRHWDDVVRLEARNISLPSGMLQSWPVGSPLTLHSLAALMISQSDNTATDTLLEVVGRAPVEQVLGISPLLSTRELFVLKADTALKARWLAGDIEAKRAVLREADLAPLPTAAQVLTPYDEGVEYELSVTTLCGLMEQVAGLDVMQINPGIASPADWAQIAFKGGSDVGVVNLTIAVTAKDGTKYCVSATWNGPAAIPDDSVAAPYGSLLAKLAKG